MLKVKELLTKILQTLPTKADVSSIPTKTSDITNDSNYKSITYPYAGGSPDNEVTSLTTGTWTVTGEIPLGIGTHLITVKARTAANATGRRTMILSSNNNPDSSGSLAVMASTHAAAVNGDYTDLLVTMLYIVTTDNHKIYVKLFQNSGTTLACNTRVADVLFG